METTFESQFPTLDFTADVAESASVTGGLVERVMDRCPELTPHKEALEELVLNERQSRRIYLEANIIDNNGFESYFSELLGQYPDEFWVNASAEAKAEAEAHLQNCLGILLREPLELIDQNGNLPIAEKLKILRSKPWRVLPIGYLLNVADWEGTGQLDAQVEEFVDECSAEGGNIAVPERKDAPRSIRLGTQTGMLLPVVRTREVAWINDPDGPMPSAKNHVVALRKRSVFALDITQMPEVQQLHLLEERFNRLVMPDHNNNDGTVILPAYTHHGRLMHPEVAIPVGAMTEMIARKYQHLLKEIERQIHYREKSPALITIATSYNFRQKNMPGKFSDPTQLPL